MPARGERRRRVAVAAAGATAALLIVPPAASQAPEAGGALLLADEIVYDSRSDAATATGAVELSRGGRTVRADRMRYDRRADVVSASGNVALMEPGGEVVFAGDAALAGDLKTGTVRSVGVLFPDRSRLAAAGGHRTADGRTTLAKAVYSPCAVCGDAPERAPLWQIKAARVVHDPVRETISYSDPRFEVLGVPVFYLPFFEHAAPTVERKTGFLPPTFAQHSTFGLIWTQPYFIELSPHSDATITPILASRGRPVLVAQYREETTTGSLQLDGSVTREDRQLADAVSKNRLRGHIDLAGDFDLGGGWRYGFAVERASDSTYLARYDFADLFGRSGDGASRWVEDRGARPGDLVRGRPFLKQNVYLRGRTDNREITLDALYFQPLGPEADVGATPIVAPLVDITWRGDPGFASSVWSMHANARVLMRPEGADSRRMSATARWQVPLSTRLGDRYTLGASLRLDGYHATGVPDPHDAAAPARRGFAGRIVPQATIDWHWPWVRTADEWHLLVEPLVKVVLTPGGDNPDLIRNDDSLAFEFDDINLLADGLFPGLDRVEGGSRVGYALRVGAFAASGRLSEFLVGQSYRPLRDDAFSAGSGVEERFSDIVGRLTVRPARYLDLMTRFRLDRRQLSIRRSTLAVAAGPEWLRGRLSYVNLSSAESTAGVAASASQIDVSAVYRIDERWQLGALHRHDLSHDGGALFSGASLLYEDECVTVGVEIRRNFTSRPDVEASTDLRFRIRLRNLD